MSSTDVRGRKFLVITRGESPGALKAAATTAGLAPWWLPVIKFRPRPGARARLAALLDSGSFDWIAVTSSRSVHAIADAWPVHNAPEVAAVGPATAAALRQHDVRVSLVATGTGGHALARALAGGRRPSLRVIWPRASGAARGFARALRTAGATVVELPLYDTLPANARGVRRLDAVLRAGRVGAMCFSSPSTVRSVLVRLSPPARAALVQLPSGSFGVATSAELRRSSFTHILEIDHGTALDRVRGLVSTLRHGTERIA